MSRRKIPVDLVATMRLPGDPEKAYRLDLGGLQWQAHGLGDWGPAEPAMLDLLEIARVVHEFDRRQPKRTTGIRAKQVRVNMPVRDPQRWTSAARADLSDLLRIQGNSEWIFEFTKRTPGKASADRIFAGGAKTKSTSKESPSPNLQTIALFSGGLDSTSGLATLAGERGRTLLVGYYSRNRQKQLRIAEKLGFARLAQVKSDWVVPGFTGRMGGQFYYRSILFLSLAAVLADVTGAPSILQFENGPLALAVPPLDIYRITRHAHPLVHQHLASLFEHLTGRALAVSNPFIGKTKGEATDLLRRHLSKEDFQEVIRDTETCWYLNSRTIVAGQPRKDNGQACGACVPCLVRRAALGTDDIEAGVDFKKGVGSTAHDPVARVHYEAYSLFARRLLNKEYGLHDFMEEIPAATRSALNRATPFSPEAAFDLYQRFAREWIKAFGQDVP
jgi:7-cyano-7-deazaguanine synthase in queuosine biosynthesis